MCIRDRAGIELFDTKKDPKQYINLAGDPKHKETVTQFRKKLENRLKDVRDNDL